MTVKDVMDKTKKVLQGLECCIRKLEGQRVCDECPYDENFNYLGCSVVLRQAIALLREQEPVEPKREVNENGQILSCGNCGAWFAVQKQKYCHECGRAVKWDE